MFVGALEIVRVTDWSPGGGTVVSWHPTPKSLAKAAAAPASAVPVSYMQAQHLRGFHEFEEKGLDYSRLVMVSWDEPGQCDQRAMSYVINAHLRRHDTYHSWFEYRGADQIIRHTFTDPADIKLTPAKHGQLSDEQFQKLILTTPDPKNWDCFSFGVIQHEDHFTFYVVMDHVHCDPMLMACLFAEVHQMYETLIHGGAPITLPPPSGYDAYCLRQHEYTSGLTADSPQVKRWIEFASRNDGTLPEFALPLGDASSTTGGEVQVVELMDPDQTAKFESACIAAGSRFVGGVFAVAALAQYQLTGVDRYNALTPKDMRTTPEEFMTTGWFTGMVPVDVPVSAESFADTAKAAQVSFDGNTDLAKVPFDRVLELVPSLRRSHRGFPMLAYLDAGLPPLSAVVASHLDGVNATTYSDGRSPAHICMWVGRVHDQTAITVFYPDNPVAKESVTRYLEAIKSVCTNVAEGRDLVVTVQETV